jgi:hypothetical protein
VTRRNEGILLGSFLNATFEQEADVEVRLLETGVCPRFHGRRFGPSQRSDSNTLVGGRQTAGS